MNGYASSNLLELVSRWENEAEITKEEFVRRTGVPMIYVDGSVEVGFDSDNMFTDQ